MARVQIPELEAYVYEVELPIMLAHINRGDHLGNEHLIAFLNEARVQYMAAREYRCLPPLNSVFGGKQKIAFTC